ncbi:MAG: cytochrome P450 [Polaromonas sp.]
MQPHILDEPAVQAPRILRPYDDLPGPPGVPVFGNALQIKASQFHLQLEQMCLQYGPFFKLKLGRHKMLVVAEHHAVACVLRDRPDGLRRTSQLEKITLEMGLPTGLFVANGDTWQRQRRMVMAGFDPAHVRRYFPALQAVSQRLVGRWQRAAQSGEAIDLQADLMRYTVDTIAGLAFGAQVNTLESDADVIQAHLNKIFPAILRRLLAPVPTWRFFPSPADRELAHSMAEVNAAVAGFIRQARARLQADPSLRQHPGNLLEVMILAADEPGSGIDDSQVAGNVLTLLLAGEDTTANTLAWMIHLLWRHPEALRRASDEVRRLIVDAAKPTFDQVNALAYVDACAHETMRLKPVAPLIQLETLHEMTIADVQVPAGIIVSCLMRRDSVSDNYLPHAVAFEPERWLSDGEPQAAVHDAKRISMPFGAGPRICPGRYLALLEMKMAMAALLGNFDIESVDTPDGKEAREHLAFTMAPVGLRLRLRARSGAANRSAQAPAAG